MDTDLRKYTNSNVSRLNTAMYKPHSEDPSEPISRESIKSREGPPRLIQIHPKPGKAKSNCTRTPSATPRFRLRSRSEYRQARALVQLALEHTLQALVTLVPQLRHV